MNGFLKHQVSTASQEAHKSKGNLIVQVTYINFKNYDTNLPYSSSSYPNGELERAYAYALSNSPFG